MSYFTLAKDKGQKKNKKSYTSNITTTAAKRNTGMKLIKGSF